MAGVEVRNGEWVRNSVSSIQRRKPLKALPASNFRMSLVTTVPQQEFSLCDTIFFPSQELILRLHCRWYYTSWTPRHLKVCSLESRLWQLYIISPPLCLPLHITIGLTFHNIHCGFFPHPHSGFKIDRIFNKVTLLSCGVPPKIALARSPRKLVKFTFTH